MTESDNLTNSIDLELRININLRDDIIKQLTKFNLDNNSQLLSELRKIPYLIDDELNNLNYLKISMFKLEKIIELLSVEQGYHIRIKSLNQHNYINLDNLNELKIKLDKDKEELVNYLISLKVNKLKYNSNLNEIEQMDYLDNDIEIIDNIEYSRQIDQIDGNINGKPVDDIEIIDTIKYSNKIDQIDDNINGKPVDDIEIIYFNDHNLDDNIDSKINPNTSQSFTSSKQQIIPSKLTQQQIILSKVSQQKKSSKVQQNITSKVSQQQNIPSKIQQNILSKVSQQQNIPSKVSQQEKNPSNVSQQKSISTPSTKQIGKAKNIKMAITNDDKKRLINLFKKRGIGSCLSEKCLDKKENFYLSIWFMNNIQCDKSFGNINKVTFFNMIPSSINNFKINVDNRMISKLLYVTIPGIEINTGKKYFSNIKIINK